LQEQTELIRKDEIPRLLAHYQPGFVEICNISKPYYEKLLEVRDSYCDPLTSSLLFGKGKITLKNLIKLRDKLTKQKDTTS
jgi:hypothetical protein